MLLGSVGAQPMCCTHLIGHWPGAAEEDIVSSIDGQSNSWTITFAAPRGWKAVGMAVEEVAIASVAIGAVSGDGVGGRSVVSKS